MRSLRSAVVVVLPLCWHIWSVIILPSLSLSLLTAQSRLSAIPKILWTGESMCVGSTVEPPNSGHIESVTFVLCWEVVLISEGAIEKFYQDQYYSLIICIKPHNYKLFCLLFILILPHSQKLIRSVLLAEFNFGGTVYSIVIYTYICIYAREKFWQFEIR